MRVGDKVTLFTSGNNPRIFFGIVHFIFSEVIVLKRAFLVEQILDYAAYALKPTDNDDMEYVDTLEVRASTVDYTIIHQDQ
jgi:hypothetical protein